MRSLFILLLFTSGCSLLESPRDISLTDSGPIFVHDVGSPSDAGPSEEPRCSKDPQRMRDKASCAGDENCPCGSYCWLGQCHFECLDGERPCAEGQRCGLYGRCVASEDSEEIPELEAPEAGKLVISRSWLQVLDRDQQPVVKLSAEGAPVGKVRVTAQRALQSTLLDEQRALADEHVEVSCSEFGDDFATECSFSNIEPEAPQKIRVRAAGSVDAADRVADQWTVQLHWPRGQRVITMKLITVPQAPDQVDGLYEGRYELRSPEGAEILSLPVRAEVLAGDDRNYIRLIDDAKVLGALNESADVWGVWDDESADLTTFALLQSGRDAGDYQAHLQHSGTMGVTSGGTLIANFDVTVSGVAPRDEARFSNRSLGGYGGQSMKAVLTLALSAELPDEALIRSPDAQEAGRVESFVGLAGLSEYWGSRGSWGGNLGWKAAAQSLFALTLDRRTGNSWRAQWDPEIIDYISLPQGSKSLTACETDYEGDPRYYPNYLELRCRTQAYRSNSIRLCEDVAAERARIGCTNMLVEQRCMVNGQLQDCLYKCLKPMGSGPLMSTDKANYCAQRYMCYSPPLDESFDAASNGMSASSNRVSGDLTCDGVEPAESALGFLSNPDRSEDRQLTASQLFGACIRDLNREAPGVESDAEGLRAVFQSEGCIDLGRYFNALRWSSWAARDRIGYPERSARDNEDAAHSLYLRLVGAWAQLHQYLAIEGLQTHLFNRSLPESDELLATESINLAALTEQLARGMEMLTNTYFVGALTGVPSSILAVPDYRMRVHVDFASGESWHRQSSGLPVFMLESLGSYFEVVYAHVLQAWEENDDLEGSAAAASLALRQSLAIESLARRLWTKAGQQDLSWNDEMQRALNNSRNWRQKLMSLRQSIARGANALGVSDDDLAFVYDPELELGRLNSVSKHLLGGYVLRQIDFAATKYSLAGDAWTSLRAGIVQQRNFEVQQADRQAKIKAAYGSQFTELCGDQLGTGAALEWARDLADPMFCGLDNTNDDCELDKSAVYDLVTPNQLRVRLAQMHWYRRVHNPAANFVHEGLASLVELATFTGINAQVSDLLRTDFTPVQLRRFAEGLYLGTVGVERSEHKALQARGLAEAFLPNAQPMPTLSDVPNSPLENTACYVGSVGSAMSASRMSGLALKEAQANAQGFVDSYRHAASSCQILVRQHDTEQRLDTFYTGLMIGLTAAQTALQVAAELTDVDAVGLFTSGGAKGVSAGAKAGAAALGGVMTSLTLAHNNLMTNIANNFEEIRCFHDAEMHLIGLRAASLRVQQAILSLDQSRRSYRSLMSKFTRLRSEGADALADASGFEVPAAGNNRWLSQAVRQFHDAMQQAKRATYIGLRAIEWEYQRTLSQRSDILSARRPAQLRDVVNGLELINETQQVQGSEASNFRAVISLRDHLLQARSQKDQAPSDSRLSKQEHFQSIIMNPKYAVYSGSGNYQGQRIPFDMIPFGEEGLGNSAVVGVKVLSAANDCIERLWSINVNLIGVEGFNSSNLVPPRIDVYQSNSFYNRWCGSQDGYQHGSVNPQYNVIEGSDNAAARFPGWTVARVEASINREAEEFARADFSDGDSRALAFRGLYGSYALFFPAESLAVDGRIGLDLRHLNDVHIRLNYISAAGSGQ